jgi:replicative DNA helicase
MNMFRQPPANLEAEQALLGAILANNECFPRVSETLRVEHFADPLHGKLYDAASKLIARGQLVSPFTLKTFVETDLKPVGGPGYLAKLVGVSVAAIDAASAAREVRDQAIRRKLIDLAQQITVAAYEPQADETAASLIERLERGLYELATGNTEGGFEGFVDSLTQSVKSAEAAHKRAGGLAGIATGMRALDRMLGGLHRSDLIVLAGRPSMGKTALATNIAVNAAQALTFGEDETQPIDGARVGFFSLEMSSEQLATRILADKAGIPSNFVREGKLTQKQADHLIEVSHSLETLPLYIDPTPALSIASLRTRARRLQRQKGLDMVVVDYLQLVDAEDRRKRDGRVQEVSEITRGLKTLAKELDVPVLALSQLSRNVEGRSDKRPQLSDLRDSGTIEQDADVVMFVYREEYYLERSDKRGTPDHISSMGRADIIIDKQRHGPTGTIPLKFDAALTRFSDLEGA